MFVQNPFVRLDQSLTDVAASHTMSDRIRSLTLFTAFLFAAACGGGTDTSTGSQVTGGSPSALPPTTAVPAAPTTVTPPAAICGNNKIEGTEVCDGTDLGGKTCAMLVPGSSGIPKCNQCRLDMLLCISAPAATPMGGAGAAQGGSGARTPGSAGAGGSGRM